MAFRLPGRLKLDCKRPFGRRWNVGALIGLSLLLISPATPQIARAGQSGPAVSVDYSVLERLGPPPAPSRFLLAANTSTAPAQHVAANSRAHARPAVSVDYSVLDHLGPRSAPPLLGKPNPGATKRQVATTRSTNHAVGAGRHTAAAKAPFKTASSLNRVIHLIPPKSRLASAAPTRPAAPSSQTASHREVALSTPSKTPVAKLVPAAVPKPPLNREIPTPPVMPAQQARAELPPAAAAPPSESAVAKSPAPATVTAQSATPSPSAAPSSTAKPDTSASIITTRAETPPSPPIPSSTTSAAGPAAMTIAATTPNMAVTSTTPPAAVASPVQVAAATTVGSAESAVKFNPGVTDLGSGAQPTLDAIVNRLMANQALRIELVSHATGAADDAMEARRVSLARAIAVRGYLIDKGVRSLRINVRALGNHSDSGPVTDQVDLLVVSQ